MANNKKAKRKSNKIKLNIEDANNIPDQEDAKSDDPHQATPTVLPTLNLDNIENKCWYGKIPCIECDIPNDLNKDIIKHYYEFVSLQKSSLQLIKENGNAVFQKHDDSIECISNINADVHALEILHSTLLKNTPQTKYSIEYIDTLYFQKKIIAYELASHLKLETMYLNKFYGDLYRVHFKLEQYISSLINLKEDIKLEIQSFPLDLPKYNNVSNDNNYTYENIKKLGILVIKNIIHISKCICSYLLNIDSLQTNESEGYHVTDFLTNLNFETCKVMIEIGFFYKIVVFIFKYQTDFALSSYTKIKNISEEINIKHNSI
jgi:hypothetical protein